MQETYSITSVSKQQVMFFFPAIPIFLSCRHEQESDHVFNFRTGRRKPKKLFQFMGLEREKQETIVWDRNRKTNFIHIKWDGEKKIYIALKAFSLK